MSTNFVGEIRMFGGNFAPSGWATCDGQLLAIAEYDTLFNLIGTTYGGDGQETFALPNLAARVPIHEGSNGVSNYLIGENGGANEVTLSVNQLPGHTHTVIADNNAATQANPTNQYLAALHNPLAPGIKSYGPESGTDVVLNSATMPSQGGNQPHDNLQPFLAITYIISLFGIYPSPT